MIFKKLSMLALGALLLSGCQNTADKQASQENQDVQQQMQDHFGQQPLQIAPSDVSDQELQQLASAIMKMQMFNQQIQQQMIDAVELQGLNAERYTEIHQSQQSPDMESNATQEELKNFESANEELMKIQMAAQQQMEEIITEEGLTMERYEGIAMLIQQDPSMQEKFQQIMAQMAP